MDPSQGNSSPNVLLVPACTNSGGCGLDAGEVARAECGKAGAENRPANGRSVLGSCNAKRARTFSPTSYMWDAKRRLSRQDSSGHVTAAMSQQRAAILARAHTRVILWACACHLNHAQAPTMHARMLHVHR